MAVKLFAAIVIGSTETEMKLYDLSQRRGIRQLSCVSRRIDLGIDAYDRGRLSTEKVERLVETLKDFRRQMDGFHVDGYRMVGTSALREIRTGLITKDHIEKQTGLSLTILSNSEQRFLDYKSIASQTDSFEEVIKSGTAIVDIGGSSVQISVFDKDKLFTTQNIRIGKISTQVRFHPLARNNEHYEKILAQLMDLELTGFGKLYQKDRQIKTLIATNRELQQLFKPLAEKKASSIVSKEEFLDLYRQIVYLDPGEITTRLGVPSETARFAVSSMIICRSLLERFEADSVWLPDVSIGDGLAYDFAMQNKAIRSPHAFDEDIIAASRSIAKRYKSNQAHTKMVEEISLILFDRMKKVHGMGKRERLLLQISAILHNCGKYISLRDVSDCAYNIIMATEIIGLSHAERQIVANVVRFNTAALLYFDDLNLTSTVSMEEYLVIAKLTAILRAANALDRSHSQRISSISVVLKGDEVVITAQSGEDLTLEKGTLEAGGNSLFEEVFNLKPVLHQKKPVS